jgi:hypothetical protein
MIRVSQAVVLFMALAFSTMAQEALPTTPLSHRDAIPADITTAAAPVTLTVPAETLVNISVLSGMHTEVNRVNDPVIAQILRPVYVKGKIALPPGSLLDGHITMVRNPGHLHRPGELGLRFDRITLPDGQEKPVAAVLAGLDHPEALSFHLDAEGHLTGNRNLSLKALFGGVGAAGAYGALKIAAIGSGTASLLLPAAGAGIIGYEALWRHGREVNVPPDMHCSLRLNYPVTVRVPW